MYGFKRIPAIDRMKPHIGGHGHVAAQDP